MSRENLMKAGLLVAAGATAVYAVCRFFSTPKEEDIDFFRYDASVKDCRDFFGSADIISLLVHENKITEGITAYNVPAKDGKQVMVIFDNQEKDLTVYIKNTHDKISRVVVELDKLPIRNLGPADEGQVTGTAMKAAMHICRMLDDPKQFTSQKTAKVSFAA